MTALLKCFKKKKVVYKTFAFDYIFNALALDNNLKIFDSKEDARKELLNKHDEGIKDFEEYRDILLKLGKGTSGYVECTD